MNVTIDDFIKRFGFDWISLLVGWRGLGTYSRLITLSEIRKYALEQLEHSPESNSNIVELATASDVDTDIIESHLERLAPHESSDYQKAVRKWVVSLLYCKISELPKDPIYGLLGLAEFWISVGSPAFSPHIVQGKENELTPTDYYTLENFNKALEIHEQWIKDETTLLEK